MLITWITNVPCAGGYKAASQDTAPVRERRQYGNAVQFLAIVRLHQRRKGLTNKPFITLRATTHRWVMAPWSCQRPGDCWDRWKRLMGCSCSACPPP